MTIPCRIKSLKYVQYGNFQMSPNSYADVTVESEKNSNRYRMLRVSTGAVFTIFTEAALEYAIERGEFSFA
ncbi:MAG: hypothetical protein WAU07_05775 [Microgenomates group bacterium]